MASDILKTEVQELILLKFSYYNMILCRRSEGVYWFMLCDKVFIIKLYDFFN